MWPFATRTTTFFFPGRQGEGRSLSRGHGGDADELEVGLDPDPVRIGAEDREPVTGDAELRDGVAAATLVTQRAAVRVVDQAPVEHGSFVGMGMDRVDERRGGLVEITSGDGDARL